MKTGRLFYVMGPSGAGKDTLLAYARARIGAHLLFAHRYITRPSGGGEEHVELTSDEFRARSALGLFALQWTGHGLHYGIGVEIDSWMARGAGVVVNGSRATIAETLARYPQACLVHIEAPPHILAKRLAARKRESETEIAARLARQICWQLPYDAECIRIENSGTIEAAGDKFIDTLLTYLPAP